MVEGTFKKKNILPYFYNSSFQISPSLLEQARQDGAEQSEASNVNLVEGEEMEK